LNRYYIFKCVIMVVPELIKMEKSQKLNVLTKLYLPYSPEPAESGPRTMNEETTPYPPVGGTYVKKNKLN